jgi:hypothetical protein
MKPGPELLLTLNMQHQEGCLTCDIMHMDGTLFSRVAAIDSRPLNEDPALMAETENLLKRISKVVVQRSLEARGMTVDDIEFSSVN